MSNDFQKQIDALWAAVRRLEQNQAEIAAAAATPGAATIPRIEIVVPEEAAADQPIAARESAEIPAGVEAAIKATLSAVLGHEVQIRSVKLAEKPTTWTTQGRVAQQSSHNQRTTRS